MEGVPSLPCIKIEGKWGGEGLAPFSCVKIKRNIGEGGPIPPVASKLRGNRVKEGLSLLELKLKEIVSNIY